MPDQEGIETIREIHRDYPSIRIVAMSGAMDAVYLKTAELLGVHVALRKPIDGKELLRTLRELLVGWITLAQPAAPKGRVRQ